MQTNILDEIQGIERIQLKQEDFIVAGSFSNTYRCKIHNVVLAVKCFQDQTKAEEENASLQEIQRITGIIQYQGMKKVDIEIIGAFSGSYNGYAIFFQQSQLDLQKMLGIVTKLQTKEIFNLLSQNMNLQTFIIQLISSFNQLKPTVNNYVPSFKSDILNNAYYSTIILALFEEQDICLTRIHAQFNLNLKEFDTKEFHKDCDNQGSTLVIMHSDSEQNSFFGGMAVPSWNQMNLHIADPADKYSWLFKIEVEENMIRLHQWKCIKKDQAIYCSPEYGPYFGFRYQYFQYYGYFGYQQALGGKYQGAGSQLSSNNKYYEKVNFENKTMGFSLQFQLKNAINYPRKVSRAIMNEEKETFYLDSCEVFAIKK